VSQPVVPKVPKVQYQLSIQQEWGEYYRVIPNMSISSDQDAEYFMELLGEKVLKGSPTILRLKPVEVQDTSQFRLFLEKIAKGQNIRNEIDL